MSGDVQSNCVALKFKNKPNFGDIWDEMDDFLTEKHGDWVYSAHYNDEGIALYKDCSDPNPYGITSLRTLSEFPEMYDHLKDLCKHMKFEVIDDPLYFKDYWYNGVDCTFVNTTWDNL